MSTVAKASIRREGQKAEEEINSSQNVPSKKEGQAKPLPQKAPAGKTKKLRFSDSVESSGEGEAEVEEEAQQAGGRAHEDSDKAGGDKPLGRKLVDAAAARAQALQASLKNLTFWHATKSSAAAKEAAPAPTDRGSSPPTFVQKLTATWAGSKDISSFTVADLGLKVAIWATRASPDSEASLFLYDPQTKTLNEQRDLEVKPDAGAGATLTAGEIRPGVAGALLFGGKAEESQTLSSDSWFYSTQSGEWARINFGGKPPEPRRDHAAAYCEPLHSFFIFGGEAEDGKALADTFQLLEGKWTELTVRAEAPARSHHTLSAVSHSEVGEHLVSFGGLLKGCDSNDLWSLPVEDKGRRWSEVTDAAGIPPTPRHGHSAVSAGPRCFIFGGLGRHWMGWEVTFFDINVFDLEANSWFEVLMLSPLASTQTHGYAVAAGNPNSQFHIFATGADSQSGGAVYSVGAVCSTLDISTFSQGIQDAEVVSGDNRDQLRSLQNEAAEVQTELSKGEEGLRMLTAKADELAASLSSLLQRIESAHADVSRQLKEVGEYESKANAAATTAANRESEARTKLEELDEKASLLINILRRL
ncbi:hypothetical protein Efla_005355 [Eimeria flavescens]